MHETLDSYSCNISDPQYLCNYQTNRLITWQQFDNGFSTVATRMSSMGRAFIAIVGALVASSAWILKRNPASVPNATNRLDLELNLLPPVHRMHQRQQAQRPVQAIWSRPGSSSSRRQWGRLLLMLFFVDSILWTEAEVAYLFQPYRYCVF